MCQAHLASPVHAVILMHQLCMCEMWCPSWTNAVRLLQKQPDQCPPRPILAGCPAPEAPSCSVPGPSGQPCAHRQPLSCDLCHELLVLSEQPCPRPPRSFPAGCPAPAAISCSVPGPSGQPCAHSHIYATAASQHGQLFVCWYAGTVMHLRLRHVCCHAVQAPEVIGHASQHQPAGASLT